MIEAIKQIVINYINYANLSDVVFGTVTAANPVTVKLETTSNLSISSPFLVVTERFKKEPLNTGEKVVLVKAQGGQKYVIMDRL